MKSTWNEQERTAVCRHEKLPLWGTSPMPYEIPGGGRQATIQAYLCPGSRACVVIFPGGGYFQLSEQSEGTRIAEAYNARGVSAFVACYRYEPYDGRAILADGQRAVQYVRYHAEECGIDGDKIAVCGFSAGGHLALLTAEHPVTENIAGDAVGETDSAPDALILGYPVLTLEDGTFPTMPRIFLGSRQNDSAALAEYSYPHAIGAVPPAFLFYSKNDTAVDFLKNSEAMAAELRKYGKKVMIHGYGDGGHGVGLGTSYQEFSAWHDASVGFLAEIGFLS